MELHGRTAVVTGGASGMGRAMAERFARAGMRVVLADIEAPALDAAVDALRGAGADAIGVVTDVSSESAMRALAARADEAFGGADVVCLNAGVGGGNGLLHTLTTADWQWTLGVNLWGIVHGIPAFLPGMLERDRGHVVITASIAGLTSFPGMGPYTTSKHAAVAIAETLFSELRDMGSAVGVSCLCPGVVHTNIATSDRNRPEALRRPLVERELTPAELQRVQASREIFQSAKPPHEVAELVHDAVVERRFWIFTDDVFTPAIERRLDAIRDRTDPPARGSLFDVYFE